MRSAAIRVRQTLRYGTASTMKGRLVFDANALGDGLRRDLTGLVQAAQQRATRGRRDVLDSASSQPIGRDAPARRRFAPLLRAVHDAQGIIDAYRRYNEIVREVAAATGALLIEREDDIPGDPAHFADTVHFTDAGSAAMAARVTRALANDPTVRELAAR